MSQHSKPDAIAAFKTDSIPKIVIKNSIPALIAMVMVMVYNLADTFFLGLTHNDLQVTAVSFATPLFMIFMSLGTLFGVGGTSVISRALGAGQREYAKSVCSFCMWACVGLGALMMALLWLFLEPVTLLLGAGPDSLELTKSYLRITVGCGIFSMLSNCFSNILRTEGQAMRAMTGTVIGNLLNIVLDPIFILGLHWGVVGAAVATVIGNAVAAGYYICYFLRGRSALSISPRHLSRQKSIVTGVLAVGISASLANLLVSLSAMVVNARLSDFAQGDLLVAGYGVTSKVVMIVTLIGIGIGSGVQPFLGYCYGARDKERLLGGLRWAVGLGLGLCLVISALCFAAARPLVEVFLTDAAAVDAGVHFTRILMSTAWLIGAFVVCQNALQAMGAATPALLASLLRQGVIFIPALFILQTLLGIDGLIWAQPLADVLSLVIIVEMLKRKLGCRELEHLPEAEAH